MGMHGKLPDLATRRAGMEAVLAGEVVKGDVVIVRYEGPKGGPGMQEMLALTGALQGRGLGARGIHA